MNRPWLKALKRISSEIVSSSANCGVPGIQHNYLCFVRIVVGDLQVIIDLVGPIPYQCLLLPEDAVTSDDEATFVGDGEKRVCNGYGDRHASRSHTVCASRAVASIHQASGYA